MTRSSKSIANEAAENALNAAQVLFSLNPVHTPTTTHFLEAQGQFFKDAEELSSAWFERRQEATRTALDLASYLVSEGMRDPGAALQAIADWQAKSMERLTEDAKDCTEFMSRSAGSLIATEDETKAKPDGAKSAKENA